MTPYIRSVPACQAWRPVEHLSARLRRLGATAALACALSLQGCTTVLPPPIGGGAARETLRAANLAPAAVGEFKLAAGKPAELDFEMQGGLRGANIEAPGRSFSRHLGQVLKAELHSAGLLDPQSDAVIEGQLTESKVDAAIGTGTARLAARFQVRRAGGTVFDKEVSASDSWDSSFVGAIAVPRAVEHYGALYRSLVLELAKDADFRRALARQP